MTIQWPDLHFPPINLWVLSALQHSKGLPVKCVVNSQRTVLKESSANIIRRLIQNR